MLTLNKLEKLMEMEAKLRDEYQEQLEGKDKEIAKLTGEKETLAARVEELQGTINTQLETITACPARPAIPRPWRTATGNCTTALRI